MEDKKNKRKLFKRIGAVVGAVVVAIVAFSLPFLGKFDSKSNSKNMIASADEVTTSYTFNASDLYNFQIFVQNWGNSYGILNILFSASFFHTVGDDFVTVKPNFNRANANGSQVSYLTFYCYNMSDVRIDSYNLALDGNVYVLGFGENDTSYRQGNRAYVKFRSEPGFNANVYSVNLRLSSENLEGHLSSTEKYLILSYYDENNKVLQVEFSCPFNYIFMERSYYLVNFFNDNQFYNNGYNAGYNAGSAAGEAKGYTAGYNAGEVVGYNNGYSVGANASGEYTFFSLVSAVIDAPIQAFMGLFNFELLGINLAGFFTGLLTLAFIITIVRLVMP